VRTALLIFAILALSSLSAMAEEAVRIIEPWARASVLSSRPVAVYLTIESVHNDRLISVESPIADRVTIHATQSNDGVSRMMHLSALDLPSGRSVVLAPGGTHLMLVGQTERLSEGAQIPVTLRFEKAGEVSITVRVLGIGAMNSTEENQ